MLRVTAILEGGLDLEKGEEIPRSIVVTNGKKTVTIPVPEAKVQELVDLFATELGGAVQQTPPPAPVKSPDPIPVLRPKVLGTKPLFEVEPEVPSMPTVDESGFVPGEEYEESGTGVSSL